MKLKKWAQQQGIAYVTAWRWFRDGKLPVRSYKTATGMILVEEQQGNTSSSAVETVVYARVSSYPKKDDLQRQAERCYEFCIKNGWPIRQVVKEVASGMNDHRPKLMKLLASRPGRIVVEHKDRLTRFGFGYFEQLLPMIGCELIVLNRDVEEPTDLMKDLVSVITSFCCRLYGLRRGHNKAATIKRSIRA